MLLGTGLLILASSLCAKPVPVRVVVHVHGVEGALEENVRASLAIEHYHDYGPDPDDAIRRLYHQARLEIRQALEPYGYFSPHVESALVHRGSTWTATFHIQAGQPVRVSQVNVKVEGPGARDPVFKALIKHPPIRSGQRLLQSHYTSTKQALQEIALTRGYLKAHFLKHVLRVDPSQHTATVSLVFATGPRYRFGKVTIHQKILKTQFVRRYVHIRPGSPYNTQRLSNLQAELSGSNYFSSVSVIPETKKAGADLHVPIRVETTPAKRNHYAFGVGYGTDTGPRFRFSWENRRVDSEGHRFRFDVRVSGIGTEAHTRYIIPLANPATDRLVFSAVDSRQDYGDTVGYLLGTGVSRITQNGPWQTDEFVLLGRYRSELGNQTLTSRLITPGITFSKIRLGSASLHEFGYNLTLSILGASRAIGSDATFLRGQVSAHLAIPLGPGDFLLRGALGAVVTNEFSAVPVAERFYAGGEDSVRGYAYQSIGPRNALGQVVGGRYLKVGSIEYDWYIVGHWGIAGFFDLGTASDSLTASLDKGVGIGVRYFTPVGAIRVDFSHPIAQPQLSFYMIQIGIGLSL